MTTNWSLYPQELSLQFQVEIKNSASFAYFFYKKLESRYMYTEMYVRKCVYSARMFLGSGLSEEAAAQSWLQRICANEGKSIWILRAGDFFFQNQKSNPWSE